MAKSLPRIQRIRNGARLFVRSLQSKTKLDVPPRPQKTTNGISFNLYALGNDPIKTVIPVYGMGLLAEDDPRLNKFTQACLEMNTRVAIPILPGLKTYLLDGGDVEKLIDLLLYVYEQYNEPVSIIAFSAGASIALSACADPSVADKISSVVVFSPLYDIREAWIKLHRQEVNHEADEKKLDEALWTQYVIAYRNRGKIGLAKEEDEFIEDALRRWNFGLPLETKHSFHIQTLAPLQLSSREDLLMENDAFDILSPRGKLKRVKARVSIIHDTSDSVVPPSHGQRVLDELNQRDGGWQRLLITPLLTHVTIQAGKNILDALGIMDMLGEIYA